MRHGENGATQYSAAKVLSTREALSSRSAWCYNSQAPLPTDPDFSSVRQRGPAMPYRLACADFTFPLLPHARVLKLIAMLEFEGVDIGLFEGRSHLRPSQEFVAPARSGAALKRQLDREGLVVADVFLQMDPDFAPYAINQPDADAAHACTRLVRAYAGLCRRHGSAPCHDPAGRAVSTRSQRTFPANVRVTNCMARGTSPTLWARLWRRTARWLTGAGPTVWPPTWCERPRADSHARLHPLHTPRHAGRRS